MDCDGGGDSKSDRWTSCLHQQWLLSCYLGVSTGACDSNLYPLLADPVTEDVSESSPKRSHFYHDTAHLCQKRPLAYLSFASLVFQDVVFFFFSFFAYYKFSHIFIVAGSPPTPQPFFHFIYTKVLDTKASGLYLPELRSS